MPRRKLRSAMLRESHRHAGIYPRRCRNTLPGEVNAFSDLVWPKGCELIIAIISVKGMVDVDRTMNFFPMIQILVFVAERCLAPTWRYARYLALVGESPGGVQGHECPFRDAAIMPGVLWTK